MKLSESIAQRIPSLLVTRTMQVYLFFCYAIFSLLLFMYSPQSSESLPLFYLQCASIFFFVIFFLAGTFFSPYAFMLFVLIYQLSLSVAWGEFFLRNPYLLDNNGDWKTYVSWASQASSAENFFDYAAIIKHTVFETADMGYPLFLYPYYKMFTNFEDAYFASVVGKALFYSVGTIYVYKIAKRFLSKPNAKLAFLLWALNPAAIFFNGVNLKENVFVTICIFAVYNMLVFKNSKNVFYLLGFLFFTFLTIFFRMFVTFFIFATFLSATVFQKLIHRHFTQIWIVIALLGFVAIKLLMTLVPALGYFVSQSVGGGSGISMPVLILSAFVSPIPAFNQSRTTPDNLLVCAYSIFTIVLSFYAVYEIFLIFKHKRENLYPLVFLTFFNKLLVIVSARSNEYRFQYPLVFSYVVLMICGFADVSECRFSMLGKKRIGNDIIAPFFLIMALGLTYLYNGKF